MMKWTKINFAYLLAAFVALSIFFIACNGNEAEKQEATGTEEAVPPTPDTLNIQENAADTIKIDSSRTEQNPPAIRRPSSVN
ncbi:MAG TPA: hypothetical protein PKE30_18160 [Niabella sp.]|nr:hypothetical protein [Niabella sp.]